MAKGKSEVDKPEPGKLYSLCGIAKGKSWAESEVKQEYKYDTKFYEYLDGLRESGVTNMFGAAPYLAEEFDLEETSARKILADWMVTFEAHNAIK